MKRALTYFVAALITAATITGCGNGDGEVDPPVALEQYEWVALEQLQLPTPVPEKAKYAILVGQFADAQAADEVRNRVMDLDLHSSIIPVVDKDGRHWFFVSAGSFESLDYARENRLPISHDLGFSDPLPLILLPM